MIYAAVLLIGAVFVLVYRGIGWRFVRSYAGDWLVVQFIYVIVRLWVGYQRRWALALAVLMFSFAVEIVQLLAAGSIPKTMLAALTIGSTFAWGDLVAYVLGVITVLVTERFWKPDESRENG